MAQSLFKPSSFDPNTIQFSPVKTNSYGGKIVYINRSGNPILVQSPEMTLPYGLSENEILDQKTGEVVGHKYHVNLSFKGMDTKDEKVSREVAKLQEFHKMLQTLDDLVISEAQKNSLQWLKMKKASRETIEALYSPIIIKSKDKETQEPDGKYPDTIKGKIGYWEGEFKTQVFDDNKEKVEVKPSLVKGTMAKAILKCNGIWFAGGKFGVGWKIEQMKVKVPESLQGYSFVDSEDDDDEEGGEIKLPSSNMIEDSDSDEEINLKTESSANLDRGVMETESDSEDE